jgi:hypothetical protein
MLHRSCIQTWHETKVELVRVPDCPCCNTSIEEKLGLYRSCFFSADEDPSRVEPTAPQDTLDLFSPATRQFLELLEMLKTLKLRLATTDQEHFDNMFDDLKLGVIPKPHDAAKLNHTYEKLRDMVKKVGAMWAEGECIVSRRPEYAYRGLYAILTFGILAYIERYEPRPVEMEKDRHEFSRDSKSRKSI